MQSVAAWNGFRSIVCAVDFSEQSARALQYAGVLARRGGAALTALHVADPLLTAAAAAALRDREMVARSERELDAFTSEALVTAADVTRTNRVVVGNPADEILASAASAGADLIVLGTSGLTGARRLLLGSTTLSVLERTPVPVLAVPGADDSSRPSPDWPGPVVAAAVEHDARTRSELRLAADIAAWLRASLLIVHVAARRDASEAAAAALTSESAALRTDAAARVQVVTGDVGPAVAAAARAAGAGLVMTMLRDRLGWFGPQRGSVSYDVVTHATTPVLALAATA